MSDPLSYPGAPRWVKVSAIVIGVATLLIVVLIHAGGGHNMLSTRGLGSHVAPASGH
jgi:hypothetical protein